MTHIRSARAIAIASMSLMPRSPDSILATADWSNVIPWAAKRAERSAWVTRGRLANLAARILPPMTFLLVGLRWEFEVKRP